MSTIKISELATNAISLTDFFAKADANGLASKNDIQGLSNLLNTVGTLAFRGVLLAADAAVTLDGIYVAGDAGTYTNNGGLVITVSNQIVLISITGSQTVFEKVEIPITITIDATATDGSTNAIQSNAVYNSVSMTDIKVNFTETGYYKNSNGVLTDSNTDVWINTSKLPITELIVLRTSLFSSVAGVAFFDSNNVFISAFKNSSDLATEVVPIPLNAATYACSTIASAVDLARVYAGDNKTVGNLLVDIYTDLDLLAKNQKFISRNETKVDFNNDGFYRTNGVFDTNPAWVSSDILTITEDLMFRVQTFFPQTYVADMVLFDASNNFIKSIRFNNGTENTLEYIINDGSYAKFALTKLKADTFSYARYGESTNFTQILDDIDNSTSTSYTDNLCLYIGDSISTKDDFQWKGFLTANYRFIDIGYAGNFRPSLGGKTLFPPTTENTSNYSMWYLCGNQRLIDYTPNVINLFGGTNDFTIATDLGLASDTAYIDTDATRPTGLTWASAFKGCIDMLQRDFPNIEIIINTVMDVNNGDDAYNATYTKGEFMARLQMEIATDYGLKCVPFYWNTGITIQNYEVYLNDNVHPNEHGARRMANVFGQTLFLK